MVYVSTLPCTILKTTFSTVNVIRRLQKKSSFYFGGNNCQFLSNDFLNESYQTNTTYFRVTGALHPWGRAIIAMAADDVTNVNYGFKQFVTAVGIYAATNRLW